MTTQTRDTMLLLLAGLTAIVMVLGADTDLGQLFTHIARHL